MSLAAYKPTPAARRAERLTSGPDRSAPGKMSFHQKESRLVGYRYHSAKCHSPGVLNIKVRVDRNMPMLRMLSSADAMGDRERMAIREAITISAVPSFEVNLNIPE
jgi:hypothetical protein